jgi:tetratricopeptide (TPR) repeat protein
MRSSARTLAVAVTMTTYACATALRAPPGEDAEAKAFRPPPGSARVYVFRPHGLMGPALHFLLAVDGQSAGTVDWNSFVALDLAPDTYNISAASGDPLMQAAGTLKLRVEGDRSYFVAIRPSPTKWLMAFGVVRLRVHLAQVDEVEGRREVARRSLAQSVQDVDRVAAAATAARDSGNWIAARDGFRRALEVSRTLLDVRRLAIMRLEYGRASGVLCDYGEARNSLDASLRIGSHVTTHAYISLLELARLHYDQRAYAEAVRFFERLTPLQKELDLEGDDPIGLADALTEFAVALDQVSRAGEAAPIRAQAGDLRARHPGAASKTTRTPYGTACPLPR